MQQKYELCHKHAVKTRANNFSIEKAGYLDPKTNNAPKSLLLDGRE